ncbi:MAG TPA: sigma-70 family RNA polymerase sigma factor [Solirubrobacteraceae bacterium]|nr:sigma-70 family RNA polymerase sigma factor [Solirubrobacteraceae bacterium]
MIRHHYTLSLRSDEELMRLVQQGRVDAYEVLYTRVEGAAYGLARQLTRNPALAEEVTQDAFVTIWRRSRQYQPERGSVRSWMLRIVHNHAIDGLRSSLRHDNRRALIDDTHERQAGPDSTELEVSQREQTRTLKRMLTHLPADQRTVLELAFFDDLTHSQIARTLDLPMGTVKGRARLGLGRMRDQLDDRLVAELA